MIIFCIFSVLKLVEHIFKYSVAVRILLSAYSCSLSNLFHFLKILYVLFGKTKQLSYGTVLLAKLEIILYSDNMEV